MLDCDASRRGMIDFVITFTALFVVDLLDRGSQMVVRASAPSAGAARAPAVRVPGEPPDQVAAAAAAAGAPEARVPLVDGAVRAPLLEALDGAVRVDDAPSAGAATAPTA